MAHSYNKPYSLFLSAFIILLSFLLPVFIEAQQTATPEGSPIEISGIVTQINDDLLTVAGLPVDITGIILDVDITEGTAVTVTGYMSADNVIIAQLIVMITPDAEATAEVTPEVTAEPSATPTPTNSDDDIIIVIEGPVVNIVTNIITIYDFDIEVQPTHPMLNIIQIGDIIHVEGSFGTGGAIVANIVSNVSSTTIVETGATASIEGPIESINGNIVMVNGIPVQFAPDDPQLASLVVGNFLSVQGNFESNGNTVVLVIVNVTIVNNVIIDGNPYCWYHEGGMGMGHWHCDGMGMGGMGMGMGMGMGG